MGDHVTMEILQTIAEKYAWLIALLALFGIEVSPIKFNPITLIGRLLGKFLGIDKILERIVKLETDVRDNELDRIKAEILQFSGSLRNGLNRNETDYLHIESIYIKYVKLGGNSHISHELDYIRQCHDEGKII